MLKMPVTLSIPAKASSGSSSSSLPLPSVAAVDLSGLPGTSHHAFSGGGRGGGGQGGGGADTGSRNGTTNQAGGHTHTIALAGGGDPETRPVNVSLLAVIKF